LAFAVIVRRSVVRIEWGDLPIYRGKGKALRRFLGLREEGFEQSLGA
jgi:hypothetical protein